MFVERKQRSPQPSTSHAGGLWVSPPQKEVQVSADPDSCLGTPTLLGANRKMPTPLHITLLTLDAEAKREIRRDIINSSAARA